MATLLEIVNSYGLAYTHSYEHQIFLREKQNLTRASAVEARSPSISEALLRALENEESGLRLQGMFSSIEKNYDASPIHRATNHKWHAPELSEEEIYQAFADDLLARAEAETGIPLQGCNDQKQVEIKL